MPFSYAREQFMRVRDITKVHFQLFSLTVLKSTKLMNPETLRLTQRIQTSLSLGTWMAEWFRTRL